MGIFRLKFWKLGVKVLVYDYGYFVNLVEIVLQCIIMIFWGQDEFLKSIMWCISILEKGYFLDG